MEFAFNLFIIGIVVAGFCFLLCIGGLLIGTMLITVAVIAKKKKTQK